MRILKWTVVAAAVLLLTACGVRTEHYPPENVGGDSFYEQYHLTKPVEDELQERVIGIKACLDWMVGGEAYEFRVKPETDGTISLLAYNEEGEGISILSQIPMPDGSYEVYSSTVGTYDVAVKGFVATSFSTCFFYETETGRVIPSYIDREKNPEYEDLYDHWMAEKDGG